MNGKLYALLALAALVSAAPGQPLAGPAGDEHADDFSQSPFFPGDENEVSRMPEELKPLFRDFCISTRDEVQSYLTNEASERSIQVINVLMNALHGLATEALTARLAHMRTDGKGGAGQLEAGVEISASDLENQIVRDLEAAEGELGEPAPQPGLIRRFANRLVAAVRFVARSLYDETMVYFQEVKSQLGPGDVTAKIELACQEINYNLHHKITSNFVGVKNELINSAKRSKNADLQKLLASASVKDLRCTTAGRVMTVQNACDTFKNYSGLIKLAGTNLGIKM